MMAAQLWERVPLRFVFPARSETSVREFLVRSIFFPKKKWCVSEVEAEERGGSSEAELTSFVGPHFVRALRQRGMKEPQNDSIFGANRTTG
jgi:hypothetical protein